MYSRLRGVLTSLIVGLFALGMFWPSPASADALSSIAGQFEGALNEGSMLMALGLIFLAGLATALTPCVYPMIAITVSIFGARETESKLKAATLSGSFVLGIAALFTPLGVISALSGKAMGSALQSPWILSGLAILFIGMAFSMFGFWDMNLPPKLQNALTKIGGAGVKGAFGVGFVNGLIAAPCTGPVLAALLTYVGTTQSVAFGATALFVYSLGLGSLFFVVGTFAAALPKSGRWLDWVKSIFGIVMLVVALYYLRTIIPFPKPALREQVWLIVSSILALVGIGLGAIHLSFKYTSTVEKARKAIGILLATAGLLGVIFWMDALPAGAQIKWLENYESAKAQALESKKPLLVDFGAEWCGACKEFEHGPMSDPRVVSESQRFVSVRIDMTHDDEKKSRLLSDTYKQPGLPLVVIHHADGREFKRLTGLVSSDEFLDILRGAK